jgi:hypothetical protein
MKIVNINDIEELILAKHEIDLNLIENKEIENKMELTEFINKYATPTYIYIFNEIQIPFKLVKICSENYLFVLDKNEDNINILINKLKLLKYNMDNLVEISTSEMMRLNSMNNIIIHNSKYYM